MSKKSKHDECEYLDTPQPSAGAGAGAGAYSWDVKQVKHVLLQVLMPPPSPIAGAGGAIGLPIAPLIGIIAGYAVTPYDGGTVSTAIGIRAAGFVDGTVSTIATDCNLPTGLMYNPVTILRYTGPVGWHPQLRAGNASKPPAAGAEKKRIRAESKKKKKSSDDDEQRDVLLDDAYERAANRTDTNPSGDEKSPVLPSAVLTTEEALTHARAHNRVSYFIVDAGNRAVRQYFPPTATGDDRRTAAGGDSHPQFITFAADPSTRRSCVTSDFIRDSITPIRLELPRGFCVHPLYPNRFFLSDNHRVVQIDRPLHDSDGSDTASLCSVKTIAGSETQGGDECSVSGAKARFTEVKSVLCSRNGKILYALDAGNRQIKSISIATGETRCVAGSAKSNPDKLATEVAAAKAAGRELKGSAASIGSPQQMIWDATVQPGGSASVILCDYHNIVRVRLHDGLVTLIPVGVPGNSYRWCFYGLTQLSNGYLLVSDIQTCGIYAIEPESGAVTRLTGKAVSTSGGVGYRDGEARESLFCNNFALTPTEDERAVLICDNANHCIRRLTLPPAIVDFEYRPALKATAN